jgi:hypothetical protein
VKRVRILFAGVPPMLQEIIERAARAEPDLEIVGATRTADLAATIARTGADAAILALPDGAAVAAYEDVLYCHPRVRLLAVVDDGRSALLYALRPHLTPLGELSADGLLQAVRSPSDAAGEAPA